jgi:hypothetical protein
LSVEHEGVTLKVVLMGAGGGFNVIEACVATGHRVPPPTIFNGSVYYQRMVAFSVMGVDGPCPPKLCRCPELVLAA